MANEAKLMELKIEKGVPTPAQNPRKGRDADVFRTMAEGDSVFFVDKQRAYDFANRGHGGRDPFHKPMIRAVEGGWRVWKVKRDPKPNGAES